MSTPHLSPPPDPRYNYITAGDMAQGEAEAILGETEDAYLVSWKPSWQPKASAKTAPTLSNLVTEWERAKGVSKEKLPIAVDPTKPRVIKVELNLNEDDWQQDFVNWSRLEEKLSRSE